MSLFSIIPDYYYTQSSVIPRDYRQEVYFTFFSKRNIDFISYQITRRLDGLHPEGKHIIVPEKTIISVMDSFYRGYPRDVDKLTAMTIGYIVDHIKNEYAIENQNNHLDNWVVKYLPESGMQQVPKIKLREKRPTPMLFNMHY